MGGVNRFAEPGSIGVHKSSFSDSEGVPVADAVSEIQQLTAEIIGYMTEMGVDPGLLQLAFSYNSDDIRYLSGSEMSRYKLTTSATPDAPAARVEIPNSEPPPTPREQGRVVASLEVPVARSGTVRYPKGEAALKKAADPDSESVALVRNGTPVAVDQILGDWYAVTVGRQTGYMHHTWVRVDQASPILQRNRFIQGVEDVEEVDLGVVHDFDPADRILSEGGVATEGRWLHVVQPRGKGSSIKLVAVVERAQSLHHQKAASLADRIGSGEHGLEVDVCHRVQVILRHFH